MTEVLRAIDRIAQTVASRLEALDAAEPPRVFVTLRLSAVERGQTLGAD